jgi:hypothetical protein
MIPVSSLRLGARTPVCDHENVVLYFADRTRSETLLHTRDVDVLTSGKRVKAFRYRGPDPAQLSGGSHHKRPIGTPHRNETYYNVKGCWHLDRIPDEWQKHFCMNSYQISENAK